MTTRPQPEPHLDADQLNAFAEGALSPPERELCLQHLAECAHCREIAFLAGASIPLEESAPAHARRFSFISWPVFSLGAAALAAVLIAMVLLHHTHQTIPSAPVQIATESNSSPSISPMTDAEVRRAPPAEPKARAVTKPSPLQKAPPKPVPPSLDSGQVRDTTSFTSMAAPAQPAAGVAQQLKAPENTLHGIPNASAGPVAQPAPPARASAAAKAAPGFAPFAYNAGSVLRTPNGSAQVAGTITDSSGAAIPHAKVTLDQATGTAHRETLTDSSGRFTIGSLPPGKYRLQISSPGFQAQNREVELGTSQLARLNSQLAVGAAAETVTVEAAAPTLNTASASVQSTLTGRQPFQTSVNSGSRTLALDNSGNLFLSKKAGNHWKAIHGPWKKSAVTNLSLTPDQNFKVTTALGFWLSADGEHWHPAN